MKKFLVTTIVFGMIVSLGAALAQSQSSQSHLVEVRIPRVVMIRLTLGPSTAAVTNPSAVVFDLSALTAATFEPAFNYRPISVGEANWDDVKVFANVAGWRVSVATNNAAFDWRKVHVTPRPGPFAAFPFTLPAVGASTPIFIGTERTRGWRSLGFGPGQFWLSLDGTEAAGTYRTTVTYTITNP